MEIFPHHGSYNQLVQMECTVSVVLAFFTEQFFEKFTAVCQIIHKLCTENYKTNGIKKLVASSNRFD